MKSKVINLVAAVGLLCAPMAYAVKNGFDTTCTQGNGGHQVSCNTTNSGVQTTSGPHGQVKQGKENTNTTTCGPGNSTGC